jgi:hypothetical protein
MEIMKKERTAGSKFKEFLLLDKGLNIYIYSCSEEVCIKDFCFEASLGIFGR